MKKIIFFVLLTFLISDYCQAQKTMELVTKEDVSRKRDEDNMVKRKMTLAKLNAIGASAIMIEKISFTLDQEIEMQMKLNDPNLTEEDMLKMKKSFDEEIDNDIKEILGEDLYIKFKEPIEAPEISKPAQKVKPVLKKTPVKKNKS